jgi:hypothetical protein
MHVPLTYCMLLTDRTAASDAVCLFVVLGMPLFYIFARDTSALELLGCGVLCCRSVFYLSTP